MYIGQQPSTTFDSGIQDRFTGLTTNTVTLTHDISSEVDILVVWNNIVQDSSTYSVGGTGNRTLTLGGTLSSGDVVTVYYTNRVMQSVSPTAGSVQTLSINDGAVTNAKLANSSITLNGSAVSLGGSATISAGIEKYFLIHLSSDFSFNTGSWTKVQWGSVQHNTGMTWDSSNYQLTPGATGIYLFINHCAGEGIDNEKEYDVQMYKNSGSAMYGNKYWYSAKTGSHPMVTATYVLKVTSATDNFSTYVYTNNSTNEHVAQNQSYFACIKIGDI